MKTPDTLKLTRAIAVGLFAILGVALLAASPRDRKEKDHPIVGSLVGACWYQSDPSCGCESNVTTLTAAAGQLAELGAVGMLASHCAPMPPYTKYVGTHMTLVTSYGELWATYDTENTGGNPSLVLRIVGGTGRFKHATGNGTLNFNVVPQFKPDGTLNFEVPWPWSADILATIRYCASHTDCRGDSGPGRD